MAETTKFEFSYREVAEALIRQQGLTEGIWAINFRFGLGAALAGPNQAEPVPTAMVPVMAVGIHKVDKESHLSVDASKLHKPTKSRKNK